MHTQTLNQIFGSGLDKMKWRLGLKSIGILSTWPQRKSHLAPPQDYLRTRKIKTYYSSHRKEGESKLWQQDLNCFKASLPCDPGCSCSLAQTILWPFPVPCYHGEWLLKRLAQPLAHIHLSATAEHWCVIGTIWAETRAWGGSSAELIQIMANNSIHFYTLDKHSPCTAKNTWPCFLFQ